ncbi:MAG: hypothetical protein ACI4TU_09580 [Candidatus Cryptobacteroides sp.]
MNIKCFIGALLSLCLFHACGKHVPKTSGESPVVITDGIRQLERLWSETSPFNIDDTRKLIFNNIQSWADGCTSKAFGYLMTSDADKYALTVKYDNILSCYDRAFERVIEGLKNERPKNGEIYIWMVYNMGYIVKTPSVAFAIDIYHYRAEELEPYLDFVCSTHIHQDHKSEPLFHAMYYAGKPVLTNFYSPQANYKYCSSEAMDYEIGGCKIHTFITRHNNGTTNVPVTVFQIDCGDDTDNCLLLHSGDSNFILSEYSVTLPVDIYIPRYAQSPLEENNVIGKAFEPDYVLLSHILELSHKDESSSRWSLSAALNRASSLDCKNSIVPFWGEGFIWKNNELRILK